ncbi:hypothetical protein [Paenibacillus daejeonensis]|uniref:hypothetical protein n=1 Tax=Paenibacillus daejeonensis TaxID=135193 RepID=UPI0003741911|nr:hypothetical protein [Paenibacillus daejeonensis]
MDYYIEACRSEHYMEKYMTLVLEHYEELNLPYTFPVALSFLSSPLLMNKKAFVCFANDYETVGAFGYIRGTADEKYTNRHIAQLQIVFIQKAHRGSRLFLEGMRCLAEHNAMEQEPIREFRFWVPTNLGLQRLLGKFATLVRTWDTENGLLDEYRMTSESLEAYVRRFVRTVAS